MQANPKHTQNPSLPPFVTSRHPWAPLAILKRMQHQGVHKRIWKHKSKEREHNAKPTTLIKGGAHVF